MKFTFSTTAPLFLCILLLSSCSGTMMSWRLKDKHFPPEFGTHAHTLLFEIFGDDKYETKLKALAAQYYTFPIEFVTEPNIDEQYPDKDAYRYTLGLRPDFSRINGLPMDWVIVFDRKTKKGYQSPFPSGYHRQVFRSYLKEMQVRMGGVK